jgi:hypothetical protein
MDLGQRTLAATLRIAEQEFRGELQKNINVFDPTSSQGVGDILAGSHGLRRSAWGVVFPPSLSSRIARFTRQDMPINMGRKFMKTQRGHCVTRQKKWSS